MTKRGQAASPFGKPRSARVRSDKVEDSCYESHAFAKSGKRSEIHLNPATGKIVGNERNG